MTRFLLPLLIACNTAPRWDASTRAPGAAAPWDGPSDAACARDDDAIARIDGYLYCDGGAEPAVPVDDPVFRRCSELEVSPWQDVLYVTDGRQVRGYPLELLSPRKLLHDEWDGEPILVEY